MSNPKHEMTAVELFSGIGGFRIACDRSGIKTVLANDISSDSCDVYRSAFGKEGVISDDVRNIRESIPSHDLLTAGFPCQPFSSAGKKQGVRDVRGTLFAEIVKVIKENSPKFFVLENVKRLISMESGEHFGSILDSFSELPYFLEWRLLNATDFGLPQNRQRIFIVGQRIDQTKDARVCLADIRDLDFVLMKDFHRIKKPASWTPISDHDKRFPNWGMAFEQKFFSCDLNAFHRAIPAPPLHSIMEKEPDEDFFMDESTVSRIKNSIFVNRFVGGVRILYNQGGGARMGYTVFGVDGVAPTLTASHSRHYERYKVDNRYRRLTNVEYARLQGFPDDHCKVASVFNQYGLYGNSVPPPMAEWVVNRLTGPKEGIRLSELTDSTQPQMAFALV